MITTLTPLCLPFLIGFLSSFLFIKNTKLNHQALLMTALAIPVGFGIVSLVLFWSYAIGGVNAPKLGFALIWFLFAALTLRTVTFVCRTKISIYWKRVPNLKSINWIQTSLVIAGTTFFLYCLWRYLEYFAAETTYNPFGGWDARYMWNIKARFYTRVPEFWADMFLHPKPWWTLPDYPHLLPGSVAWGWLWLGRESLGWPAVIGLSFFLSTVALVAWFLWSQRSFFLAIAGASFLISIPAFQFWSTTQYADIPLCFFITSATLVTMVGLENQCVRTSVLGGFLTGLAAWTKNEGIPFFVICGLLFVIHLWSRKIKNRKVLLAAFLIAAAAPILTVVYLKSQLGGAGIYIGSPRGFSDYWKLISDPNRIVFILGAFLAFAQTADWLHLWQLGTVATLIFVSLKLLQKPTSQSLHFPLSIIALMLIGYFGIYLITPIELKFHIRYTMGRLLLHVGVLMFVIVFETLPDSITHKLR